MKKMICTLMSVMLLLLLAACSGENGDTTPPAEDTSGDAVGGSDTSGDSGYPTMSLTVAALDSADTAKAHDIQDRKSVV